MRLTRGANLPLQRCRCRDLQVFQEPVDRRSPLARLSCTPMQACRVFGLFRPQVWWGDNSARRGGGSPSSAGSSTSGTIQKLALRSSTGAMASTSIALVGNLIENEKAALRRLACCVWIEFRTFAFECVAQSLHSTPNGGALDRSGSSTLSRRW